MREQLEIYTPNSDFSIDSFRLRVPFEDVKVLNNSLLMGKQLLVSESTGEVLEEKIQRSHSDRWRGISTTYKVQKMRFGKGLIGEYLTIGLNSKSLGDYYFDGITENNYTYVIDYIKQSGVVGISTDAFLNGACTDIDFKRDLIPHLPAKQIVKHLEKTAPHVKRAREGMSSYTRNDNTGIQYGLRTTNSTSKPFLKLYEKVRELNCHSVDFYNTFLSEKNLPSEILRAETTVKNKKHLKILGAPSNDFKTVITNLDTVARNAFTKAFKAYLPHELETGAIVLDKGKKLVTYEKLVLNAIKQELLKGYILEQAIENVLIEYTDSKFTKRNLKRKINGIWDKISKADFRRNYEIVLLDFWAN